MKRGEIYIFSPFKLDYNPERFKSPFVGLFLERIPDPSRWRPTQFRVLGPRGVEDLYCNQWATDPVPNFVEEK